MKTFIGLFICVLIFASWKSPSRQEKRTPANSVSCSRQNLVLFTKSQSITAKDLFTKTVNMGASVSFGWNTNEARYGKLIPLALRLSQRFAEGKSYNFTKPGQTSMTVEQAYFPESLPETLDKASSIVAADLFFWDTTTRKNPDCKIDQVHRILSRLRPRPLFVGLIPKLRPSEQPAECIKQVNEQIKTHCLEASNCFIIPMPKAIEAQSDEIRETLFQGDHLHLTNPGYEFLEELFCDNFLVSES